MPTDSLHPDILWDDVADARASLPFVAWLRALRCSSPLCVLWAWPLSYPLAWVLLTAYSFMANRIKADNQAGKACYVPFEQAKLCIIHHRFGRPKQSLL